MAGEKNGRALRGNRDDQDFLSFPLAFRAAAAIQEIMLFLFFLFFFLPYFNLSYSMRSNERGIETLQSLVHVSFYS